MFSKDLSVSLFMSLVLMTSFLSVHAADVTFRTHEHVANNEVGNLKQSQFIRELFSQEELVQLRFNVALVSGQNRVAELLVIDDVTGDVTTREGVDREEFCEEDVECVLPLNMLARTVDNSRVEVRIQGIL